MAHSSPATCGAGVERHLRARTGSAPPRASSGTANCPRVPPPSYASSPFAMPQRPVQATPVSASASDSERVWRSGSGSAVPHVLRRGVEADTFAVDEGHGFAANAHEHWGQAAAHSRTVSRERALTRLQCSAHSAPHRCQHLLRQRLPPSSCAAQSERISTPVDVTSERPLCGCHALRVIRHQSIEKQQSRFALLATARAKLHSAVAAPYM